MKYATKYAEDYILSFNGVGQFEIKGNEFLIPYDEEYGYECMQQVDYERFMDELTKRKHIWYNSWDKQCKSDYDNFYEYAKRLA